MVDIALRQSPHGSITYDIMITQVKWHQVASAHAQTGLSKCRLQYAYVWACIRPARHIMKCIQKVSGMFGKYLPGKCGNTKQVTWVSKHDENVTIQTNCLQTVFAIHLISLPSLQNNKWIQQLKQFIYMQQISNSKGGKRGYGEHENVYMFRAKILLVFAVMS